jgi:hypothetical protein
MIFLAGVSKPQADLDELYDAYRVSAGCANELNATLKEHYTALSAIPLESLMFLSTSRHMGGVPTYKDDVESLGYTILHLLRGSLPWQWSYDDSVALRNDMLNIKLRFFACPQLKRLFGGMPSAFAMVRYLRHCKLLGYGHKPDYW